jgi:hypothetical protein
MWIAEQKLNQLAFDRNLLRFIVCGGEGVVRMSSAAQNYTGE